MIGRAVGVFLGWATVRALSSHGIDQLAVPEGRLAVSASIAALAGALAAVIPGRRAARLDILQAGAAE